MGSGNKARYRVELEEEKGRAIVAKVAKSEI